MSPQMLTDVQEPHNGLWYGDGGTGKTTAIATMACGGKILLINAESGVKSRPLKLRGIPVENIEVYPGPGEEISFEGLQAEWLRVREALEKDPNAYFGVGWDSVTEIYKALLDKVVAAAVAKADRAGKERDPSFIDRSDYGVMTEQVRQLVRKYRDLPCHFAMTALTRREQDDDSQVTYQPAITPALQNDLVGWVDTVCWTTTAEVDGDEEFRGLFRPLGKYRGKDRLSAIPKWLVDPTFERVLAYANDKLVVEKDPIMKAAKAKRDTEAKAAEKVEAAAPAEAEAAAA